ncbi:MAG: glycosyltransferase family 4 protein [Acidimicrobiales bacterium]
MYLDPIIQGGGGLEEMSRTLLGALDPQIQVVVIGVEQNVVEYVAGGRPSSTVRVIPPLGGRGDLDAVRSHTQSIRYLGLDLLQVNMVHAWSGQYGVLAGRLACVPVIGVVNGVFPSSGPLQRAGTRLLATEVGTIVGVSNYVAKSVEEVLHLRMGQVEIIYNGVLDVRPRRPLSTGSSSVLAGVGRLAPEKGFDVLIDSMGSIADCRLVLFGEGSERARLEGMIEERGLVERVELPGAVRHPWVEQCCPDIFVAPSRAEGMGIAIVEAMLCEIPVVATRVGGIPEVVADGETGLLVPPDDAKSLAVAICSLLDNPQLRLEMGQRGRRRALNVFGPQVAARRYEAIYRRLLA